MTRRQYRLHGRPRQDQGLVRLVLKLAACQQRLGRLQRTGSGLQARRNRQRHGLFHRLVWLQPRPWHPGERFWWALRWFALGMVVTLLLSGKGSP